MRSTKGPASRSHPQHPQKAEEKKPSVPLHWLKLIDTPIEIFLCIGHIVAAATFVAERLI
jgi:hypothetical protein